MATTVDPDEDLVRRVGEGDPAAIQAMVARKLPRMLSLARRMLGDAAEAEDVAQEAMLRAWRQAPRWTPGQARFDTWLHRVGLNLCYDRLRRRREIATDVLPDGVDDGPAPDRGLLAAETGARVEAALARLPERQREAIVLCHYQELGNIEAAALMEISVEALESLLSRGRRALRTALADIAPHSGVARDGRQGMRGRAAERAERLWRGTR
ncbi:RNA polymerase sigma factor CnrH [Brevundimonas diminuta]|uniref:RNA polymerase sigma factor n=3 Tax=Brevundimonas TaxID=41275 RepID=A0A246KAW3_BREDI|nr:MULTISPECIES: RNA polymerase sigma factor [Brevundimonas]OJU50665.1 MAG: RNA polymerase sigma-70 factor [Brevundimonas sp. 67-6]MBD3573978.1 RNA polymerase sigma factor [Brevundimonas diminuta]MBI2249597.1 RNA polymerase sigma factor [Brevundimonas diminuta]OMG59680.1 RNA polymerase sigma-70 factor [Brevundimonas sp. ZS04]OWR18953.1 RNA polymerase sigma-70 factor [Brevundimonas diminuta]